LRTYSKSHGLLFQNGRRHYPDGAPLFVVIICAIPANYLLAEAVKRLPAATVYATFVGIGTAGTAMVGMVFFGESTNLGRICSLMLIVLGLIGLKFFSDAPG
jgi:quaternary ammonium compound-resistance protein SugE